MVKIFKDNYTVFIADSSLKDFIIISHYEDVRYACPPEPSITLKCIHDSTIKYTMNYDSKEERDEELDKLLSKMERCDKYNLDKEKLEQYLNFNISYQDYINTL